MRPDLIRELLRQQPFQPVRVHLSNGSHFDVRHPELMLVTRRQVAIALDAVRDELPERMAYCDPIHITHIEPIPSNGRSAKRALRPRRT